MCYSSYSSYKRKKKVPLFHSRRKDFRFHGRIANWAQYSRLKNRQPLLNASRRHIRGNWSRANSISTLHHFPLSIHYLNKSIRPQFTCVTLQRQWACALKRLPYMHLHRNRYGLNTFTHAHTLPFDQTGRTREGNSISSGGGRTVTTYKTYLTDSLYKKERQCPVNRIIRSVWRFIIEGFVIRNDVLNLDSSGYAPCVFRSFFRVF